MSSYKDPAHPRHRHDPVCGATATTDDPPKAENEEKKIKPTHEAMLHAFLSSAAQIVAVG